MSEHTEFEAALAGFLKAAQAKVDARFAEYAPLQSGKLETETGPKYIRVVCVSIVNGQPSGGSAYCFIDRSNGNVLKPASWKAAEKKNPRSNIFSEDFGASGVTSYGTTYLR